MKSVDRLMLSRAPPFAAASPEQLRMALDLARQTQPLQGAVIFDEGRPARQFYLVLSGHVRLLRTTAEGDLIIILHISAGQVFGVGLPLGPRIRRETAVAADPCLLLTWPNALWQVFSDSILGFTAETLRGFGERADEMSNRIVEMATKSVEQRIAGALLQMIRQCGRKVPRGIEIDFPITRQNIADMTATTIHTVSRVLSAWERQGVVESARCRIVVTDPHRLVMTGCSIARTPVQRAKAISAGHSGTETAAFKALRNLATFS